MPFLNSNNKGLEESFRDLEALIFISYNARCGDVVPEKDRLELVDSSIDVGLEEVR